MKIGLDAKRAFLNNTGLGNYSRSIILSLLENHPQNEYYLFTTATIDNEFYNKVKQLSNVKIITPSLNFFTAYWRNYKIPTLIKKYNLDVYHGLSNELPNNINNTHVKKIVTIHDLIPLKEDVFRNPIQDFFYKYKINKACKRSHQIIAISEATKQDIIHYYRIDKNKIKVIYQPVIFSPQKNNIDVIKKYNLPNQFILQVGTVEYRKNIQIVIKAMMKLKKPDLHYVIVGEKKRFWKSLAIYGAHNGLEKQLHFIGSVTNDEIISFYKNCNAVMYPSMYEGFGLPIVEGIYYGKPVLTTQGSCFEEAGGTGAFYCDTLNVDSVAELITQILKNNNTATIETGKEYIKKFSTRLAADALMKAYSK